MEAPMYRTALLSIALLGCGGQYTYEIDGSVGAESLPAQTAFWGGPFIVFVDEILTCEDMAWVQKTNLNGDEAPTDEDLIALQITYNDSDVVTGTYDVSGEAPVKAEFLQIAGWAFTVERADIGTLIVDEMEEEGTLYGSFNFGFDEDGQLSSAFTIPWCVNLKSRV